MFPTFLAFIAMLRYSNDIIAYLSEQEADYSYLFYCDLLPTYIYTSFYLPSYMVAVTGRWHRFYGITTAMVSWVVMLWWRKGLEVYESGGTKQLEWTWQLQQPFRTGANSRDISVDTLMFLSIAISLAAMALREFQRKGDIGYVKH